MRKNIVKRLTLIIAFSMVVSLALNFFIQLRNTENRLRDRSHDLFLQISQLLSQNEEEAERVSEDFRQMCFVRAKAAAYILQYHPDAIKRQSEMNKIADFLQIDELHLFNREGTLYAGSVPKYIGLNFSSGEQMQFFLPMLEDKTLELCQDITPNTAESKPMQYCAVWMEDGTKIVQIGMEPERVLEMLEKVQLSYIFSLVTLDSDTALYAIDANTLEVLGSTIDDDSGKTAQELGFDEKYLTDFHKIHYQSIHGSVSCFVTEQIGDVILVSTSPRSVIFWSLNRDTLLLAVYLVLLSCVIIIFISQYLNRNIIDSIDNINQKMQRISAGDLDTKLYQEPTPELTELGNHINEMVADLLGTTQKLSLVVDTVKLPIGIYEYNPNMKRVMVTSRIRELLALSEEEAQLLFSDYRLFERRIQKICKNPFKLRRNIYLMPGKETRYLHIEWFQSEKSTLGIIMDVTRNEMERQEIERERDMDQLTELYNRRAFYAHAERLFEHPEQLGHTAFLMIDTDDLKFVNDHYGHRCGDLYLISIADKLRKNTAEHQLLARLSGDEFALLLYGLDTEEALRSCIDQVLSMRDTETIHSPECDSSIPLRFSLGCAVLGKDADDLTTLMQLADQRMYDDKKKRKSTRQS